MSQMIGLLLNYLCSGYSDNPVTVTLFPCLNGVTVSGDLCTWLPIVFTEYIIAGPKLSEETLAVCC